MNPVLEYMTGTNKLTDDVIAMDFLVSAKSGVRNLAMAVTECVTPEIKGILERQLEQAIDTHEKITKYAIAKGLYHPFSVQEQLRVDLQQIRTAQSIPFPTP
ncbi:MULTISPECIES: spore coat protein [Paenibacillus]|uniref:spore coat protein n=1 Tax=Paenibacillus TaxID=44249 RepID=UPI000CF9FCB7|nr:MULTISPECIES: spore coat protein [Paenibacillus]MBJ9987198.1 spore coat protein [Paenibacillus sp. S28]MEC0173772.1 spore coat protein [Paenibacillus favisporus]PQP89222.1 spore coat protein [Paenibacillus sp. AR247]